MNYKQKGEMWTMKCKVWILNCLVWSTNYEVRRSLNCEVWCMKYELRGVYCEALSMKSELWKHKVTFENSYFIVHTSQFMVHTSQFKLHSSDFTFHTSQFHFTLYCSYSVILLPAHPASFAHKFLFQRVQVSPGMQ